MNTFLPFACFNKSVKVLDYRRLGKQRAEVKQILLALENPNSGWSKHPAVLMWKGYESALRYYGDYIITEWVNRGYINNMKPFASEFLMSMYLIDLPPWFGDKDFHLSHQSNLVRKDPEYYKKYFKDVSNNLVYVWPKSI